MRAADSPLLFKTLYAATRASAPLSTRLAGLFAERLWFIPWRVPVSERAQTKQTAWLDGSDLVSFATTVGTIAGFARGSGPTVLLLHGWGEASGSLGAYIEPLVRAGYRVVGIDMPGHGRSVTVEPNIYIVADVIRQIATGLGGIEAIVAHSMGGHCAIAALADGLEVDGVVLLAPSSRLDSTLERFGKTLALPPRAVYGLGTKLERRFGPTLWTDLSGAELARGLEVPALIVHSTDDPQVPFEDSVALAKSWPGARLVAKNGLGHGRILRDPTVIDEVVSFVASTRAKELAHAIG